MHVLSTTSDSGNLRRLYRKVRRMLSPLRKAFTDVFTEDYCPLYVNWNLPPRRWDNMTKVHWCVTRAVWRKRKFYALLSGVAWPVKVVVSAWKMTAQYGVQVKENTGTGLGRQFIEQVALALRHFITPRAYYFYGLYEPVNRGRAHLYVQDHEIGYLTAVANDNADYSIFDDKRLFYDRCRKSGLPTIPIIAEFEKGELRRWGEDYESLPKTDLFAKPAIGRCGQGVEVYRYEESGNYRADDGRLMTAEQLLAHLAGISHDRPYILQERFLNDPDISDLAGDALCTSRIVTCRLVDGRYEDLIAIFKMPLGNCCTDNFSTGGIAASVDRNSGVLGGAMTKDLDSNRSDFHPDTGRRIAGFRLPHWRRAVQLCLEAHAVFPDYAYVGWDVAVTERGPLLVEGNMRWGVESMQRAHYGPLGETRFAESMILQVRRLKCFAPLLAPGFWSTDDELSNHAIGRNEL